MFGFWVSGIHTVTLFTFFDNRLPVVHQLPLLPQPKLPLFQRTDLSVVVVVPITLPNGPNIIALSASTRRPMPLRPR